MPKFPEYPAGTAYTDWLILAAHPVTGVIKKITIAEALAATGADPGGGGGGGATPLSTPTLTATVISSTEIDLSWTDVANEDSYELYWSPNGSTSWTQIGGTIAAGTTTYNHTGLTPSTAYYYRVRAIGDGVTYSNSSYGTDNDTTSASGGYQTETNTYLATQTGLSTPLKDAIDGIVVAMKSIGWTKFIAAYCTKGASASNNKYNLVNPVDSDAAFRITFGGAPATFTHASTGMTADTASYSYGNTHIAPITHMTANDWSFGYARKTVGGSSDNWYDMGISISSPVEAMSIFGRNSDTLFSDSGNTGTNRISNANTDGSGVYIQTRTANNVHKIFKNGTQVGATDTDVNSNPLPDNDFYFPGVNNVYGGGSALPTGAEMAFGFIAKGLTDAEVATLTTAIAAYAAV